MNTLTISLCISIYGIIHIMIVGSFDSEHCSLSTRLNSTISQRKVIPERTNQVNQCGSHTNVSKLDVRLCPDQHFIKFSIKLKQPGGINISLCYTIQTIIDVQSLVTHCFKIHFPFLQEPGQLDCWFETEYIDLRPVFIASVNISNDMVCQFMHGEVNTGILDLSNSCTPVCTAPVRLVYGLVSCDNIVSISHDNTTTILQATFTASYNKSSCSDVLMTPVSHDGQSSMRRREYFRINCDYVGPGIVHVTFLKNDIYCKTSHDVHVLCNSASITAHSNEPNIPDTSDLDSRYTAVYIIISVVSLTAVVTSVVFFIVWRRKRSRRTRRHRNTESIDIELTELHSDSQQRQPLVNTTGNCHVTSL